ncbi:MAG: PP2C family protein-serine/threonine phosphatase [Symploca sp. SIO3C6]|uniref:PP2C family protein-serine/threonine phosphatase n=1 Tax=Symploca sp. SIO1C4 TaxID=2607765 RepID=A0A6B3NEG3_9CYAN|nr:PP2C family protein-serine/threonine phosphatase [Symploca sp. SIO3C6]NER29987.1 PP2C family protein-serine/threonine phosphatase [Symploca sp. SIO1C4]NET06430.1 PP2C family protein-serine/threonine phosphatase [Symploca sp. SIO2B6]
MTARPVDPKQTTPENSTSQVSAPEGTPIYALKQLVARLHREQHKVQNLLSSLGFALRSFNNLNQFLELIPLMSARVTDADGGALILIKPDGQLRLEQLHCQEGQACRDIRKALEEATRQVRAKGSQENATVTTPVPLGLFQESLDSFLSNYLGAGVQLFGTPILVKNAERGFLYVFSRNPEYAWTPTRQRLVRLVADQTAVAIDNDELKVELRQKERLDRELEIGAEIQVRLLPRQCPEIEGLELAAMCKTANRVGGDYYDFIPTNYDQLRAQKTSSKEATDCPVASVPWSIVIGDVMGKGVPAGLIMTMTRGMLRAEVLNRHSPGRILEHLNRVMYADLENSHRFVTLFYSEYDPQTRILSYSNAAHNPPLLWQHSTSTLTFLDTEGMVVGLEIDSEYEDAQVQLFPGDTILYYTDGLTDAANYNGDRFDLDNLKQAFEWGCQHCSGSQEILDYLFEQVEQFIGLLDGSRDDMTLVVMQVKSSE